MRKIINKALSSAVLAACLFLGSNEAKAWSTTGYVCTVYMIPGASTLGQSGYVHFTVYSQPSCGGQSLTYAYACSTGQNSVTCDNSTTDTGAYKYLYSSSQLNSLYQNLVSAMANRIKISMQQTSAGGKLQWVTFMGSP